MTQKTAEKSVLLVHPTGNPNVRQTALALEQTGMLAGFETTIAWQPGGLLERLLPSGLRGELARRSYPGIPPDLIHTHAWRECVRLLAIRQGWRNLIRHETGRFSFDAVSRTLERDVAARIRAGERVAGVYAYDACALDIFAAAKERGVRCIFDLPTGHYRVAVRITEEERELRPEWAATLAGIHDSAEKLARKDEELALADAVIVASTFTAETLKEFPRPITAPIFRIPYGAPPVGEPRAITRREDPLRVLFVGQMGHRKGLGYVIDAIDVLDRVGVRTKLTLLGRPLAVPPVLQKAFEQHRWIESAPHGDVLRLMREHDVLVFPSLFDGFGLVILEAMAQGTVVIATPHTAAPDLLDDGRDGYIVPIRSADAIAARLTALAEDRDLLARMSEAARQSAARRSWDGYRLAMIDAVRNSLV
jgi:alpha-maltose-1-phosphate synthase